MCKIVSKFLLKYVPDCEHQMIGSWSVGGGNPVEGFVLKLLTRLESESSCQIYGMDVHVEIDYNDDNNQHSSNISNHLGVR